MITGNILALRRSESGVKYKRNICIKNRKESFPSTKNILSNIPSPSLYLDPRLISRLGNRTKRGGTGQMDIGHERRLANNSRGGKGSLTIIEAHENGPNHRRYGALEKLSVIISKRSVAPIQNELATRSRIGNAGKERGGGGYKPVYRFCGERVTLSRLLTPSLSLSSPCTQGTVEHTATNDPLSRAFRPLRENYRYTRRTRESFCHGDASHAADYRVNIYRGNPLTRIGSYRRL